MGRALSMIGFSWLLLACGDPCGDYCETFVERTSQCDLGGPSGDNAVDQCSDGVEDTLTDDACERADDQIQKLSCEEFGALVCAQAGASRIYSCTAGG
jgi:hypothetical protein